MVNLIGLVRHANFHRFCWLCFSEKGKLQIPFFAKVNCFLFFCFFFLVSFPGIFLNHWISFIALSNSSIGWFFQLFIFLTDPKIQFLFLQFDFILLMRSSYQNDEKANNQKKRKKQKNPEISSQIAFFWIFFCLEKKWRKKKLFQKNLWQ